jgi:COP9 signalosome complex subunit 6
MYMRSYFFILILIYNISCLSSDREVYPDLDVVGWYATVSVLDSYLANIHAELASTIAKTTCYLVVLDPNVGSDAKELPLMVYELSENNTFAKVPFKIESDDAERVTLEHCASITQEVEESGSQVGTSFTRTIKALESLEERVGLIKMYLEDVKENKVQPDQALLREIRGLCNRLPAVNSETFRDDYMLELNDSMLITYLATLTKSSATSRAVVKS